MLMQPKTIIVLCRFIIAAVVLAAVITQLLYGVQHIANFDPANFFSFFTIESNILGAIAFLLAGWATWKSKNIPHLVMYRGATTLYMVITGIVYSVLLANADVQTPIPWVNVVLHYIFPVVILVDWLIDPPKKPIAFRRTILWLLFPVTYAAYSLIRGAYVHWYPYPFLNVDQLGYQQVLINSLGIALASIVMAIAIAWLPLLSKRR